MRLSKGLVAVAVFTALTASIASAETVAYTTFGSFGSTYVPLNDVATRPNGSSITFTGVPFSGNLGIVDAPTNAALGQFTTVAPALNSLDSYAGQQFTLRIVQSVPGSGFGDIVADLTGTLQRSSSGQGGSSLFLDFTGSVPIGNVTYTPSDLIIAAGAFPTDSTLQGTIAVVPVPMAVWGGMSLFGLLGGGRILARRRQLA